MKIAIDRLIDKIKETNNPTIIGLDPRFDILPKCVINKYPKTIEGVAQAIVEYNKNIIDDVYDIIPAVKPQIAFYEMFGVPGMIAFKETCKYAKEKGMIVVADIKRGDIGSTAEGYSNAYLGKTKIGDIEQSIFDVDFITVNPYMGSDSVIPFVKDCIKYGKGIFVLAKTSNPSSGELQDLHLEDGKEVYKKVSELIEMWGEDLRGKYGYSSVASVVGATYKEQLSDIRKIAPHTYFLIPGYGAQGGKAEDIALGFDEKGLGGLVNASRSLMCAYKNDMYTDKYQEEDYAKATREEAIRMKEELNKYIGK